MFGLKPFVNYLSLAQISPLVEDYLLVKRILPTSDISGMTDEEKIILLSSSPQWTFVQIVDQYLTCQMGSRQYDVLLRQQEILGVSAIPNKFYDGILYVNKFFEFQLNLRQYSKTNIELLLKRYSVLPPHSLKNELVRLKQCIRLIQEFELKDEHPNYSGTPRENTQIDDQLSDTDDLLEMYLAYKPGIQKIANKY